MGGNLSNVISNCKSKKLHGGMQNRDFDDLDEKAEELFKKKLSKQNKNEKNFNKNGIK